MRDVLYNEIFKTKFNSWSQLEEKIEAFDDPKLKGDLFEEFVHMYFTLQKDLYEIKNVYMGRAIPEAIKNRLRLEPTDHGVDGAIVREDGSVIAYQAKFRTKRISPTYSELSTFWSESEYADLRCIISNCYELPSISDKKKHQFSVLAGSLDLLDEWFFTNLWELANSQPTTKPQKKEPRPHQVQMIREVLDGFSNSNRGKLIAACATGKTLTSLWILEKLKAKTVLFVVPNIALIKQTLEEWSREARSPFSFLCVCSDSSVVTNSSDHYDESSFQSSQLSFPVTTNSEDIFAFLEKETSKTKIVFSTYQSLDAIVSAINKLENFFFEIGFFDEAHRTAGTKDSDMFIFGMDDQYIPISKRLFMTATERFVSPRVKKMASQTEYDIFSMDDESLYGKTFTRLNFGEAIEKKIISDYKIVLASIEEDEYAELVNENYYVAPNSSGVSTAENLLKQILLAKAIKQLQMNKIITFHRTIENAQSFLFGDNRATVSFRTIMDNIEKDISNQDLFINHVNGSMSAGKRKQIFDSFESAKISIISNARCLTEGVDVPTIDGIFFADPKNSIIDIIQAIGRALRKPPTKASDFSYIVVPIIIPHDCESFESIPVEGFNTLHNVIQALRDQDSALADIIDELNLKVATKGRAGVRSSNMLGTKIILPPNVGIEDFAEGLILRIAEVNKNPQSAKPSFSFVQGPKARQSGLKRVFRSIGDYNPQAYADSLVLPTLAKFENLNSAKTNEQLKINHNNVSHTKRIGAIVKEKTLYSLSEIGKRLVTEQNTFDEIFTEQILKYYEISDNTILFPYRAILKVFLEYESISRFEFLYSLYSLRSTSNEFIEEALSRINHLRETFSNIEILSEENKNRVLEVINAKYSLSFNFTDIWSSRTTAYNQWNYFKQHILTLGDLFESNDVNLIIRKDNASPKISELLRATEVIEKCEPTELERLYCNKIL